MESINIQLVTWNVNTQFPTDGTNFSHIFDSSNYPDIIFLGLQEVNSQPQNVLFDNLLTGEDPWTFAVRAHLTPAGFVKVRTIRLVGIILSLFCKRKHVPFLRGIETQYTRLGFGGYWGSKGGVSVRFNLYGVACCVVNCHLAAHEEYLEQRIDSYNNIIHNHVYSRKEAKHILYHDYVFWMGDLNFRLVEGGSTFDEIDLRVSKGDFEQLFSEDQLTLARKNGDAFAELDENQPKFPPTYKFKINSSVYDMKRRPAWTDRILFKANVGNYDQIELSLNQSSYKSHPEFCDSDHKPVSSVFRVGTFSPERAASLLLPLYHPIVSFVDAGPHFANEDTKVVFTVLMEDRRFTSSWDWIGIFRADATNLEDYIAYVWAPAKAGSEGAFHTEFDESVFLPPSSYMLVYFSSGARDVFGVSQPFSIRSRASLTGAEVAAEVFENVEL